LQYIPLTRFAGCGQVGCRKKVSFSLHADIGFLVDTGVWPCEREQCLEWIVELLLVTGSGIVEGVNSGVCR
jgi:hypothetical protein